MENSRTNHPKPISNKDSLCCLCEEPLKGYGHNAEPLASGRCCDNCNYSKVINKRLEIYYTTKKTFPYEK